MKLLSVKEFYQSYEEMKQQSVVVSGWVKTKRIGKEIAFVELSDGTCMKTIQVVVEVEKQIDLSFGVGACLLVKGVLKLTPEAKQVFAPSLNFCSPDMRKDCCVIFFRYPSFDTKRVTG